MMDRAAVYAGFSFAIVGFYVGVLFARADPLSDILLGGAGFQAGLFVVAMIFFFRVHKPAPLSGLPDPQDLVQEEDTARIPQAVIDAFTENRAVVWHDQRVNACLLTVVGVQALGFLAVALVEIFS